MPLPLPPHNKGGLALRIPGTLSSLQSQLLILHTPQPQGWKVSSPSFFPNTASTVLLLYPLRVMLLSPLLPSPPCSHNFPATIPAVHPLKIQALGLSFSSTLSSLLSAWLAGFCVNVSPNSVAPSISFFFFPIPPKSCLYLLSLFSLLPYLPLSHSKQNASPVCHQHGSNLGH